MKPETIKAIFTNVLFVIGVVLLIWGFAKGALTVGKLYFFEKYPLQEYQEQSCDLDYYSPKAMLVPEANPPYESEQDKKERYQKCIVKQEEARKIKKFEDLVSSITLLVSGVFLTILFKKFILK